MRDPATLESVAVDIVNCKACPNVGWKLSKDKSYPTDYYCTMTFNNRLINGYRQTDDREPQDGKIPGWCPLARP